MLFYSLMVKPLILAVGAIPVFFAILIMVPMLTTPEIPISAINSNDTIEIEYTKHDLTTISFGVTEKTAATNTQILTIKNDGTADITRLERAVINLRLHHQSAINNCKNLLH